METLNYRVYLATNNGITSGQVKAKTRQEAITVVKKYKGQEVHILSLQKIK